MSKGIGLVFVLIALATNSNGFTKEEAKEAVKSFGSTCDPPPNDNDIEAYVSMDPNPPKSTKCFMRCLMEQGTLVADGKLDVEMMKSLMSMVFENKDNEFQKMGDDCNNAPQNTDPCEQAFEYGRCILKAMEADGIEIPKLT